MNRILQLKATASAVKHIAAPCEFKAAGDTGSFTGYAAIFGNIDLGGDVIERGAFKEFVTNSDGKVVTLWQHDSRSPIGTSTVHQDDKGLRFDGQLVMEDPRARSALAHMKAKTVEGMSIGYDVLPGGAEVTESGVRLLKALKLWEISPVTWGMNPLAGISGAKTRQMTTVREFEDFLRDEGGFSNAQAKLLVSGGWKKLQAARDESSDEGEAATQLKQFLMGIQVPSLNNT